MRRSDGLCAGGDGDPHAGGPQRRSLRGIILDRFNMSLGNGLGRLEDRVFRIGHMGDLGVLSFTGTLTGVEMGLRAAGVPHQAGGVQAAMAYLATAEG